MFNKSQKNLIKKFLRSRALRKKFLRSRGLKIAGLTIIAILIIGENVLLAYNRSHSAAPILGLKLYGVRISELNQGQIRAVAQRGFSERNPGLKLVYERQIMQVSPSDVGATINTKNIAKELTQVGRGGNLFKNIFLQDKALLGFSNWHPANGTISKSFLTLKILEIQDKVNQDAFPPMPDFRGNIRDTLPAKEGIRVDASKLVLLISQKIFNPPAKPVLIPTEKTTSSHDPRELDPLREQAAKILREKKPIQIRSGEKVFSLTPDDLKDMLTVVERPDVKDPKLMRLYLRLDEVKLNRKLGQFASEVEAITGAEFDDHDARVALYAEVFSGIRRTIDIPTGKRAGYKKEVSNNGGRSTYLYSSDWQKYTAAVGSIFSKAKIAKTKQRSTTKIVYLTFDDGPNAVYHPLLLDILKKYGVKATFFLVGNNAAKYDDVAKRTVTEGNKIGNHSLTHPFLPKLSEEEIIKEITETEKILKPINNDQNVILFRPPYGGVNTYVKEGASSYQLKLTLWDVDPKDWSEPGSNELVSRVTSNVHNGSNILLHSNHLVTVKALPKIIETLQREGYTFELLP